jgi:hypothetical protein
MALIMPLKIISGPLLSYSPPPPGWSPLLSGTEAGSLHAIRERVTALWAVC